MACSLKTLYQHNKLLMVTILTTIHFRISRLVVWYKQLNGAESFMRSYPFLSLSVNSTAFYETRRFITVFTTARHFPILS